jgi:hypothetical protein
MLAPSSRSNVFFFDFFFLLFAHAISCIVIGAIWLHKTCDTDVAKWLIIYGAVALFLWLIEQGHVYSRWGAFGEGPVFRGFGALVALATLALGIVAAVKAFKLGRPSKDTCYHDLHIASFVLMIIFCVVAGLIVLQTILNRRRHGTFVVRNSHTRTVV